MKFITENQRICSCFVFYSLRGIVGECLFCKTIVFSQYAGVKVLTRKKSFVTLQKGKKVKLCVKGKSLQTTNNKNLNTFQKYNHDNIFQLQAYLLHSLFMILTELYPYTHSTDYYVNLLFHKILKAGLLGLKPIQFYA